MRLLYIVERMSNAVLELLLDNQRARARMREEAESTGELLRDEALLRRVLEREPSLVNRIVSHTDFLDALFSRPEALRGLLRAPLVRDDFQLDQLLESMGGDGASQRVSPGREEARLFHLLSDSGALGRLLRAHPGLVATVVESPAFVEQVKVRKPQIYRALLEKAQERFGKNAELADEIRAQRESLEIFTSEGGKKEQETDRRHWGEEKLQEAAFLGCTDVLQELLAAGADPNYQDTSGRTALMRAALSGHTDAVRELLSAGADPNLQDKSGGWTALTYALPLDHFDVVRVLLEGGANPNFQDKKGWTALMHAALHGPSTVQLLLAAGADPMLRNGDGLTARHVSATRSIAGILAAAEQKRGREGGAER